MQDLANEGISTSPLNAIVSERSVRRQVFISGVDDEMDAEGEEIIDIEGKKVEVTFQDKLEILIQELEENIRVRQNLGQQYQSDQKTNDVLQALQTSDATAISASNNVILKSIRGIKASQAKKKQAKERGQIIKQKIAQDSGIQNPENQDSETQNPESQDQ